MVRETDQTMHAQVLKERPQRMLLSREMMPRYSRMSPLTASRICAEECEKHAGMHIHCKVCASTCRKCEQSCRQLSSLPAGIVSH